MLAASGWGVFGYMDVYAPSWAYWAAFLLIGLGASLNTAAYLGVRRQLDPARRYLWPLSALLMASLIGTALHHSLHVDFQPQGRYLLAGIAPGFVIVAGYVDQLPPRLRQVWFASLIALFLVGQYAILMVALPGTAPGSVPH
jgi:hypothetical protein